jgi:D-alanyl-D-alanine carboxypeptidase
MMNFQRTGLLCVSSLAALLTLSACKDASEKSGETGQAEASPSARELPNLSGKLREIADQQAGKNRGFIVHVRLDDGQEWTETAGTRSEGGAKTTGEEHFEIGSASKLFTSVSILQLWETDALDLEAPLTDFFDSELLAVLVGGEKGDASKLKVRHLLNQSTGTGDYINIGTDAEAIKMYGVKGDRVYKPMELVELCKNYTENPSLLPEDHPPLPWETLRGDTPEETLEDYDDMPGAFYSNTGYIMLGIIIEKASGMKYQEYVKQNILDPLKLNGIGFGSLGAKSDFTGYATGVVTGPVAISPSFAWNAGELIATTSDLADFIDAALAGKLFKKESTLALWKTKGFLPLMGVDFLPKYGHGLMRKTAGDLEIFGHDGQTFGATALVARCEKLGATIVLARNDSQQSLMWTTAVGVLGTLKEELEAQDAAKTTQ